MTARVFTSFFSNIQPYVLVPATYVVWLKWACWMQRFCRLKMWTTHDDVRRRRTMEACHPVRSTGVFGSGKLKMLMNQKTTEACYMTEACNTTEACYTIISPIRLKAHMSLHCPYTVIGTKQNSVKSSNVSGTWFSKIIVRLSYSRENKKYNLHNDKIQRVFFSCHKTLNASYSLLKYKCINKRTHKIENRNLRLTKTLHFSGVFHHDVFIIAAADVKCLLVTGH